MGLEIRSNKPWIIMDTSYMALGQFPICSEPLFARVQNGITAAISGTVQRFKLMRYGMITGNIHPLIKQ